MTHGRSFLLALACGLGLKGVLGAAPIDLHIERRMERYNLGVTPFVPEGARTEPARAISLRTVILQDLEFTSLFNLHEKGGLIRTDKDLKEWENHGSDAVMKGKVEVRTDGQVVGSIDVIDTHSGKELFSVARRSPAGNIRSVAHELSNEVVRYFTGQPGVFNSKIVFVSDATGFKELYIADYDGDNVRQLTHDKSIVILPRISPDGRRIVFTSYVRGNPDLYLINRDGTGRQKLSSRAGLNVSPSWMPDNQHLAVTLSPQGSPNIYLMDVQGQIQRRLTDAPGADTAPSFSPDGSQMSFTSDRAGAPHIFVMNVDGSGVRRITTASHCDSSAWSPDGQTILYVKPSGNRFDIYSIEVLTGIERRLTWEGDNENPAWSPDGRSIVFASTRKGKSHLYRMNADGTNQRPFVSSLGRAWTPHWSR